MSGKRVLVVDDEVHIVHVVSIKLRNNGYEVIPSEQAKEAFQIACEARPDVIVADYQMPAMNGIELIEKLRGCEQTSDIPVIMLTARGFAIDEPQKRKLQISEVISKPFSPKELLRSIEDVLHEREVAHSG